MYFISWKYGWAILMIFLSLNVRYKFQKPTFLRIFATMITLDKECVCVGDVITCKYIMLKARLVI